MPKYLNYTGKIVEIYAPDGLSRVVILESNEFYFYRLDPPSLDEHEKTQIENAMKTLAFKLNPKIIVDAEKLKNYLENVGFNEIQIQAVMSKVQGYSWLDPLIRDDRLEDIHCFRPGVPLRVVHSDYGLLITNVVPSREEVDEMVRLLAYRGGSSISLFKPIRDSVILPTGDRAALTYRSEVSEASSFTIRKFPRDPWTPSRMIAYGTVSPEAVALLWLMVDAKIPILVYGPMRTGKTSIVNALVMLVRPDASIALVQDSPEMRVYHDNVLSLFTSDRIGFRELAKLALRKSVDYLIVNEVRVREEAYWWAQLVGTGHGGLTTIHADTLERVFGRLKDMGVERSLAESVKIAVRMELYSVPIGGARKRVRRVRAVEFVEALPEYSPAAEPVYLYDRQRDSLVRSSGFVKALEFMQDALYEEVEVELGRRAKFLELAAKLDIVDSRGFWSLHLKYRSDPDGTIDKLRRALLQLGPASLNVKELSAAMVGIPPSSAAGKSSKEYRGDEDV